MEDSRIPSEEEPDLPGEESGPGTLRQILGYSLVRFVLVLLLSAIGIFIFQVGVSLLGAVTGWSGETLQGDWFTGSAIWAFVSLVSFGIFWASREFVEGMFGEGRPTDFGGPAVGRELGAGLLIGVGLISSVVVLQALFGWYRVQSVPLVDSPAVTISALALGVLLFAAVSFMEEFLFRGVLFRYFEEMTGSIGALAVSGLFFGLVHIFNPNATLLTSTAIAVEGGILLGALYMLTGRLWMVIGVHTSWNYFQGFVFDVPVSGHGMEHSLLESKVEGPTLLTGGAFGAEASLPAVAICLAVAAWAIVVAHRRGRIQVLPAWFVELRQEKAARDTPPSAEQ